MGLLGKSSVILYDAKTGEETDRVESSNMITNAVSNLLNGGLSKVVSTMYSNNGRQGGLPYLYDIPDIIAKTFYGGVLVFSDKIEENVEHCIPSTAEMKTYLGCGNQEAAITGSKYKGILNASESVVGSNYVTFVWDFTTEQCNGDIASICLTSNLGGQLGWGFNTSTNASDMKSLISLYSGMYELSKSSDFSASYPHNPMYWSARNESNDHGVLLVDKYYCVVRGANMYRQDISSILEKGNSITIKFDKGVASRRSYELLPITPEAYNYLYSLNKDKCYGVLTSESDGTKLTLLDTNVNGGVDKVVIPLTNVIQSIKDYFENTSSSSSLDWVTTDCCVYDGKIYVLKGYANNKDQTAYPNKLRMYIISFNGEFKYRDYDVSDGSLISQLFGTSSVGYITSGMGVGYNVILDEIYLCSPLNPNGTVCYRMDKDTGELSKDPVLGFKDNIKNYGRCVEKSSLMKEPWVSFAYCGRTGDMALYSSEIITAYLATINNMDTILTKTADKTMKIIYTLTAV